MAGLVAVEGVLACKPGHAVDETASITVKRAEHPYVSRGGVKLAHALELFDIDPASAICLDAGASTGGFTDCLLKKGARKVWAIDSGRNQLDYRMRSDNRVVSLEETNIRSMDISIVTDTIDILVADVSFISLKLVIPPLLPLLADKVAIITLIKPQFEAGRDEVGKGGIVRDTKVHDEVIANLKEFFGGHSLDCMGVIPSPIEGAKGNREYLAHFRKKLR